MTNFIKEIEIVTTVDIRQQEPGEYMAGSYDWIGPTSESVDYYDTIEQAEANARESLKS